jgi:3-methylfumaryl-CoA hydratase
MDLEHLQTWIGREEKASEVLSPRIAHQFNATLDREENCDIGSEAPLMIHWCLNQAAVPTIVLGDDGHPARGCFLPPVQLPRRMWAGGALTFHDTIRIGDVVTRHSTIKGVSLKEGRTGQLCFVKIEHQVTSGDRKMLTESQEIVYRGHPQASKINMIPAPPSEPVSEGTHSRSISPKPPYLFRYSAITFNAHRIHYDAPYASEVEGYPGLIVHGPLQATLLCQYAADLKRSRPNHFQFRSLYPIYDTSDFTINAESSDEGFKLWTAQISGPVAMEAHAKW